MGLVNPTHMLAVLCASMTIVVAVLFIYAPSSGVASGDDHETLVREFAVSLLSWVPAVASRCGAGPNDRRQGLGGDPDRIRSRWEVPVRRDPIRGRLAPYRTSFFALVDSRDKEDYRMLSLLRRLKASLGGLHGDIGTTYPVVPSSFTYTFAPRGLGYGLGGGYRGVRSVALPSAYSSGLCSCGVPVLDYLGNPSQGETAWTPSDCGGFSLRRELSGVTAAGWERGFGLLGRGQASLELVSYVICLYIQVSNVCPSEGRGPCVKLVGILSWQGARAPTPLYGPCWAFRLLSFERVVYGSPASTNPMRGQGSGPCAVLVQGTGVKPGEPGQPMLAPSLMVGLEPILYAGGAPDPSGKEPVGCGCGASATHTPSPACSSSLRGKSEDRLGYRASALFSSLSAVCPWLSVISLTEADVVGRFAVKVLRASTKAMVLDKRGSFGRPELLRLPALAGLLGIPPLLGVSRTLRFDVVGWHPRVPLPGVRPSWSVGRLKLCLASAKVTKGTSGGPSTKIEGGQGARKCCFHDGFNTSRGTGDAFSGIVVPSITSGQFHLRVEEPRHRSVRSLRCQSVWSRQVAF